MRGWRTWRRKLNGLMAVCLAAALLAAPTLDGLVCGGEADAHAVEAASTQVEAAPADRHDAGDPGSAAGICVHGHCHHAASSAVFGVEIAAVGLAAFRRHPVPASLPRDSLSPAGLERPPRA